MTEKTDQRMIRNTNFQNILNNTMHACKYSVEKNRFREISCEASGERKNGFTISENE